MGIFVPFKLLKIVHKIQSRLVRELEKKFSGKHVIIIAQRNIQRKASAGQRQPKQKRPRSRTLTAVHDAILEDLVHLCDRLQEAHWQGGQIRVPCGERLSAREERLCRGSARGSQEELLT